jgi:glutathionylspermidine synthase
LIDHVNNLKLQHLVELSKLGDRCAGIEEEIEAWLAEHDVVFAGHTIPFVLMPHFVSPGQLGRVKRAVGCLSAVLDRFCDAYAEDERLREELAVPAAEDALIRLDPGFSRPLRICRLDAFLQGYDVKFLEFNADSPAGIGYTDVLHEGLARAISLPRVSAEFETSYTPMLPVLIDTLMSAYRELRAERDDLPETPTLALVDTAESPSVPEFRIICAAARDAGIEALHATLDEVEYDGSLLRVKGEPVQLVYRRALLEDLPEGDLIAAARDRRAGGG